MKKLLADRLRESRRLLILQLVAAVERRRIDISTLGQALRDMDHVTERTLLQSELRWLERQGLVIIEAQPSTGVAATWSISLTERGDLAQRGDIEEPGVARPELP